MKKGKDIELERNELNTLINRGVSFMIDRVVRTRGKGLRWFVRTKKTEQLRFKIQEPTLSVLDLIAAEQIDLDIDEKEVSSEEALQVARKLVKKHSLRLARIVALAVLNEDYFIATQHGSRVKYEFDDRKLNELTDLFFRTIKPSKLTQLVTMINAMSNLGDFTNSIRLISANRTTMPIRIEANKKV